MNKQSNITVSVFVEGSQYGAKTCVTARDGATADMIAETRRHFVHAVNVLKAGRGVANEKATSRTQYAAHIAHDEHRVTMWGQVDVPCFDVEQDRRATVTVSINVFTEVTTAQDALDAVWCLLHGLGYRPLTDDELSAKPTPPLATQNAPQSPQNAPNQGATSSQVKSYVPDVKGVTYMGQWDSRQDEIYRAQIGRLTSFDAAKVKGILEEGVARWEIYPVLSNGRMGIHPLSTVYSDNEYVKQDFVARLTDIAAPGGKPIEAKFLAIGKIGLRKKKDGSQVLTFYAQDLIEKVDF